MLEQMPSPEVVKPQEQLIQIKETIIKLVQERQLEDPLADEEVVELIRNWTIGNENLLETSQSRVEQIQFEVQRATLYFEIGLVNDSGDAFKDALKIAKQEGLDDLVKEIIEKRDKLGVSRV